MKGFFLATAVGLVSVSLLVGFAIDTVDGRTALLGRGEQEGYGADLDVEPVELRVEGWRFYRANLLLRWYRRGDNARIPAEVFKSLDRMYGIRSSVGTFRWRVPGGGPSSVRRDVSFDHVMIMLDPMRILVYVPPALIGFLLMRRASSWAERNLRAPPSDEKIDGSAP